MAHYSITITFDGTQFVYKDEHHHDAKQKDHLKAGDTIKWKLVGYGASVEIDFNKDGNPFIVPPPPPPFTAKTGNWTDKGTINQNHKKVSNYAVTAYDAQGTILHSEDPKIMFDDGQLDIGPEKFGFPDPDKIAQAAEAAWEKLFDKLNTVKNIKGASTIQFYPHGINDIEVSVGFSGVTITVKVSGPDS